MAYKHLITQTQLSQIRTLETMIADNLSAHVNTSLSKAHGIIFFRVPAGTVNPDGNDISVYTDSNGDIVGRFYMRLTYNGVNYFAPLESSVLAGKDSDTGAFDPVASTAAVSPGGTAWVTDFTQQIEEDLSSTNDNILLEHSRLGHWEAHTGGNYQIVPQRVYDSAGHIVANYVARFIVDGVELYIPCDPRLGGPQQTPRNAAILPLSLALRFESGQGYVQAYANKVTCTATWQGSSPFTSVRWLFLGSGNVWTYLTNVDGTTTGPQLSFDAHLNLSARATVDTFTSTLIILSIDGTEAGTSNLGKIRVEITNDSGTTTAEIPISVDDITSSCTVFSAGVETGMLGFSDFKTALHYRLNNQHKRFDNAMWGGYMVLGKRLKPHIMKRNLLGRFVARAILPHVAKGMRWKLGKLPFNLLSVSVSYAYAGACLAAYALWKKEAKEEIANIGRFSLMKLYHTRLKEIRRSKARESAATRKSETTPE